MPAENTAREQRFTDVCSGSKADMAAALAMSAIPPKADIRRLGCNVCFVAEATICIAAKSIAIRSFVSANKTRKCSSHCTVSARMICSRRIISTR